MIDPVYVPEKESNPDPPERSDNAQRIRLTAEMRRKMFQLQVGMLIDRQVRKRYEAPAWARAVGGGFEFAVAFLPLGVLLGLVVLIVYLAAKS